MKFKRLLPYLILCILSPVARADDECRSPHFDFWVGIRIAVLHVEDVASKTTTEITTKSEGRYDDSASSFIFESATTSPSAPGVIQKAKTKWIKNGDHFLGTLTDDTANVSTIKIFILSPTKTRGEMFSGKTKFAQWQSELIDGQQRSKGEFLDEKGRIVATSKEVAK